MNSTAKPMPPPVAEPPDAMQQAVNTGQTPLLVDAREAARLCGLGMTLWYSLLSAGRIPEPLRFGRAVRWRVDELRAWLDAGAPSRDRWAAMRKGGRK